MKLSLGALNTVSSLLLANRSRINGITISFDVSAGWVDRADISEKSAIDGRVITDNMILKPRTFEGSGLISDFRSFAQASILTQNFSLNTGLGTLNTWQGKVEMLEEYFKKVKLTNQYLDVDIANFPTKKTDKFLLDYMKFTLLTASNCCRVDIKFTERFIVGSKTIELKTITKKNVVKELSPTQSLPQKSKLTSGLFNLFT